MKPQLFPISVAIFTFFGLTILLYFFISFLNLFPLENKIILTLHPMDILVGLTIYVKTAIDFALFIGSLMHRHQGIKNRIAIEIGTALGNGIGTLVILSIWIFFKEIPLLLALMIFLAALVLLRMAEEGVHEFLISNSKFLIMKKLATSLLTILRKINIVFDPILGKLLPRYQQNNNIHNTFLSLFLFAVTIPFLLGLDDFAGYIPLFSIINVFGFATGVFLGHMLLTALLFASPKRTITFVRQPFIQLAGSLVFIGLALWGFGEVIRMVLLLVK